MRKRPVIWTSKLAPLQMYWSAPLRFGFAWQVSGLDTAYWMSYLDMVEILPEMIRASQEGNWPLHLHAIRVMIPWCVAYDKVNYARYLSVYHAQMTRLEEEHPDIYHHMMEGGFSVQQSASNPFGRVPVDQTLEETVNKDTQTADTKGFSLKSSTLSKYYNDCGVQKHGPTADP